MLYNIKEHQNKYFLHRNVVLLHEVMIKVKNIAD